MNEHVEKIGSEVGVGIFRLEDVDFQVAKVMQPCPPPHDYKVEWQLEGIDLGSKAYRLLQFLLSDKSSAWVSSVSILPGGYIVIVAYHSAMEEFDQNYIDEVMNNAANAAEL